jgi:hypothetical protein
MDIKAGDNIPLAKLNAEIRTVIVKDGTTLQTLWFDCPTCDGTHWHMIPFHVGDPCEVEGIGKVWRRMDAEDGWTGMTLAPSYNARCIHCFVRKGIVEVL